MIINIRFNQMLIHMNKEIQHILLFHQQTNRIEMLQVNLISQKSIKDYRFLSDSFDYVPPEISSDDRRDSDVCLIFFFLTYLII
jgi:hypothetical protein